MHATLSGERKLTELDVARLRKLSAPLPDELEQVLAEADLVDSRRIPAGTVTMRAQVELEDLKTQRRQVLTISYPHDADPAAGRVSVLSPVGASLLGLSVGAIAHWTGPTGEPNSARIVAVPYQPEAEGDYLA